MKKERLYYLDAARGLAILLVVLGHIWETDGPVPVLIYSFHIPLFFIISGILTAHTGKERRAISELVFSGLRRLIVPYLFFEAVFIGITVIRSRFDLGPLRAQIFGSLLLSPMNVPLWFLPTLFLSELFLVLLLQTIRSRRCVAAVCLLLYLLPFIPGIERFLPAALLRCLLSVGFLAAGYFSADTVRAKNPPLYLLLPALTAGGLLALANGKTGIYKLTFRNPIFFTLCALTGSFCVIFLLKKCALPVGRKAGSRIISLKTRKYRYTTPLELAGQNSLTILGLHIIILRVLQEILGLRTDSAAGGLLALAGICILLTPVCWFFNRFLPFLVGKSAQKTGSR